MSAGEYSTYKRVRASYNFGRFPTFPHLPTTAVSLTSATDPVASDSSEAETVCRITARAAELLPAQGPITAFVFLNTLQALEDLPFNEGVERGGRLFGCNPYLPEQKYREKLVRGRICRNDLEAALRADLGPRADEIVASLATRSEIRFALLQYPLRYGPPEELRWFVAETDALSKFRDEAGDDVRELFVSDTRHWIMRDALPGRHSEDAIYGGDGVRRMLGDVLDQHGEAKIETWSKKTWEQVSLQALWRVCRLGVRDASRIAPSMYQCVRHRSVLRDAGGEDSDDLIHPLLVRYCAAYADQGFARWPLPHRDEGFLRAFLRLYGTGKMPDLWMHGLDEELRRLLAEGYDAPRLVIESLQDLGVEPNEWEDYLTATLLPLRGWCGMLWQMEVRPDRVAVIAPPGTLVEYLAVRLLLERWALRYVARRTLGYEGSLAELREAALARIERTEATSPEQRAFTIFQLAQLIGWTPARLYALSAEEWDALVDELESFTGLERRRIFHDAFEHQYREQALDAVSIHTNRPVRRVASPKFQSVYCIDAREESYRRHLEEVEPQAETFGAAGFFTTPIYYRGVADAHFSTLCPIVVRPKHWLVEDVVFSFEEQHRSSSKARRALGSASHGVHVGSRSAVGGALLTAGVGVLASVPLVMRVLFPRLTASLRRKFSKFVEPPPVTRLRMERGAETPSNSGDGVGFSLPEMIDFGERVLRDIGLIDGFARLVMFFGHGSACLNNPHKSAYDCGACSGSAGGPNARALASMLNDARVRTALAGRGINIPATTVFLGGQHNTATDEITFFDLDLLPASHAGDLSAARRVLDQTSDRNAHERCRRFQSAPLNMSFAAARRHVAGRAEDLAQTRPEFGNASNAITYVGRRDRIRGLYLDRRAFQHSYDFTQDDEEAMILGRILGAVVVVCSGINLQYYFSYIDSTGWGCGTKLPHNVASLLGVMDGHAGDLRCGLPWQGVEIHEPMRSLFVIETTPEKIEKIMNRNPLVGRIIRNGWIQLTLLDPYSSKILVYSRGKYEPYEPQTAELPKAESSFEWYRGWREHLGFAQIVPAQH